MMFGNIGRKRVLALLLAGVLFGGMLPYTQSIEVRAEEIEMFNDVSGNTIENFTEQQTAKDVYTVRAYGSADGGTVTVSGSDGEAKEGITEVAANSDCILTATTNEGYEITGVAVTKDGEAWTPDGAGDTNWWEQPEYLVEDTANHKETFTYDLTEVQADYVFEICFAKRSFTITYTVSANGKLILNSDAENAADKVIISSEVQDAKTEIDYNDGTYAIVAAVRDPDYHLTGFNVKRGEDDFIQQIDTAEINNELEEKRFEIPAQNSVPYTVEVTAAIDTYTVSLIKTGDGTVSTNQGNLESGIVTVDAGSDMTFTLLPAEGKQIERLLVNGVSKNAEDFSRQRDGSYQYKIDSIHDNYTIEVVFSDIQTESYTSAGIVIKNQNGEALTPDISNTCYAESISLSAPGKKLSLEEGAWWKYESELNLSETISLSSLYMRGERQWFGTGKKVPINPEIRLVIDSTAPEFAGVEEEYWVAAGNTSVTITGKIIEENLDYLVWSEEKKEDLTDIANLSEENKIAVTINGSFTKNLEFSGNAARFYLYAVDKIGHCSEKQVAVYCDDTDPVATAIAIVAPASINMQPCGNFLNSALTLKITANDVEIADASGKAAGVKTIEIYAGEGNVPAYKKQVDTVKMSDGSQDIQITIAAGDTEAFAELKELRIVVVDAVGNRSPEYKLTDAIAQTGMTSSKLMIEDSEPVIVITPCEDGVYVDRGTSPEKSWYREIPDISYVVSDLSGERMGSGLKEGKVFLNGRQLQEYDKIYAVTEHLTENQTESETVTKNNLTAMLEGENSILVSFTDQAGNEKRVEQKIYLDTHAPEITGFVIEKNSSLADKFLHFFSFGNYANTELQITVTAADTASSSGLKTITLKINGIDYQTAPVSGGKAVFVIPKNGLGDGECISAATIAAYATDNVGNVSAICEMNTANSNLTQNSGLMIETKKPVVEVSAGQGYVGADGTIYCNGDTDFSITASDADSGLHSMTVAINGAELVSKVYSGKEQVKAEACAVSTEDTRITPLEDGTHFLEVTVIDNAGNANVITREVYRDETAPEVLHFDMQADGYIEADGTQFSYDETEYGYYFRENTRVIVYATDGTEAENSGVKSIEFYTVDIDGNQSTISTENADFENKAVFMIPAGFKGQIYACAYDHMDNQGEYVTPNSLIIETAEQHASEEHIVLKKADTPYRNADNEEIYAEDVTVVMTVTDMFSGIRSVEWSVEAPNDTAANQRGNLMIDNTGAFTSDSNTEGWNVTGAEKNLVTKLEKSIKVTNNSNDIVVHMVMTDRAGNTSEKSISFGIDKTIPVIEVTFDNENPDAEYTGMFKEDRIATITVTERNFIAGNFIIEIENTDGDIPQNAEWQTVENKENPDETQNITTVTFSKDGDYTMKISGYDGVHNEAETVSNIKFTIDKTLPVIMVTYDNDSALNGNYFAAERTATIQIHEHNFSEERVEIVGSAYDNGMPISFPVLDTWREEGDIHMAKVVCGADGLYCFDIEYTDMAGNRAETYMGEEFYVDRTSPTVEIAGVEDMSANNGDVILKVLLSDTNYDANGAVLELKGANSGNVVLEGVYTNQVNGQIYTFENFPRERGYDDIYTLTASLVDKAGNESTTAVTFSINRFGSVYVFDDSLKEIEGTYIQKEMDVRLTEVNADSLEHETIKVVVNTNGTPRDLTEGIDYTVSESGGNGDWYRYDYVLDSSLFAGDGRYIVTLYSEDAAGNVNENIDESKKAEIRFGVDKTAPVVIPIDIASDTQYAMDVKNTTVTVNDNLVLEEVKIYIGEEECKSTVDGEKYVFDIPSGAERRNITVAAQDAAGNRTQYLISGVLVTTNLFVRWYNNTPLFIGSMIAAAAMGAAGIGGMILHKNGRITIKHRKNKSMK